MKFFLTLLTGLALSSLGHAQIKKLPPGAPIPHDLFVKLAKKINPSVVNISTTRVRAFHQNYSDPLFNFFFNLNPQIIPRQIPQRHLGTGFIIRKNGLIITNSHVIENADSIKVSIINDKTLYEAKIVGRDKRTDIALIKIKPKKKLVAARLGSSENLQVGEWVVAFGNPFGHSHTMTKGIVSALGRQIDELNRFPLIQTDASINPGNSGGPLVNLEGRIIGVNTAIDARAQGIGFAIPIDNVKSVLNSLEKYGRLKKGYIGILMSTDYISPSLRNHLGLGSERGVLIEKVLKNSPSERAGLKAYDFITELNKKKVRHPKELIRVVSDLKIGSVVEVKFIRNGKKKKKRIKIKEYPESTQKVSSMRRGRKNTTSSFVKGFEAPYGYGFKLRMREGRPYVVFVRPRGIAHFGGLRRGDVILRVNKKEVDSLKKLRKFMNPKENLFKILRGQQTILIYLQKN